MRKQIKTGENTKSNVAVESERSCYPLAVLGLRPLHVATYCVVSMLIIRIVDKVRRCRLYTTVGRVSLPGCAVERVGVRRIPFKVRSYRSDVTNTRQ